MLRILLIFLGAFGLTGCNPLINNLSQLTKEEVPCYNFDTARIEKIKATMPAGFVNKFPDSSMGDVLQVLAGIPDLYLEKLFELYRQRIFTGIKGNSFLNGGVTEFSDNPLSIVNGTSAFIIRSSLQHEIGHAIYPLFAYQNLKGNGEEFAKLVSDDARQHVNNPMIHWYPQSYALKNDFDSYQFEYWAESFNSFYCSPKSNDMVRNHFSSTYQILTRYLEPPVWLDAQSQKSNLTIAIFKANQNRDNLVIASSAELTSLQLCLVDSELKCVNEEFTFRKLTKVRSNRHFYRTLNPIALKTGRSYAIRTRKGDKDEVSRIFVLADR